MACKRGVCRGVARPGDRQQRLLQAWTILLVQDQAVKDREHLFTVGTDASQVIPETGLKVPCFHPLLNHGMGHVYILPEGVYVMPAEE